MRRGQPGSPARSLVDVCVRAVAVPERLSVDIGLAALLVRSYKA